MVARIHTYITIYLLEGLLFDPATLLLLGGFAPAWRPTVHCSYIQKTILHLLVPDRTSQAYLSNNQVHTSPGREKNTSKIGFLFLSKLLSTPFFDLPYYLSGPYSISFGTSLHSLGGLQEETLTNMGAGSAPGPSHREEPARTTPQGYISAPKIQTCL